MKSILLILFISMLIVSCQSEVKNESNIPYGYIRHEINLKNDLGKFEIYLPPDLDTNYSIVHISDISTADRYLEYFSKKTFQVPSDTTYFLGSEKPVDSVYNLIISQPRRPLDENAFLNINGMRLYYRFKNLKAMYPKVSFSKLQLIKSNNRYIECIGYNRLTESLKSSYLESAIIMSGQLILLSFNCSCSDCSDFITKMSKSLNTIKVIQEQNSPIQTISTVNKFYNYNIEYTN